MVLIEKDVLWTLDYAAALATIVKQMPKFPEPLKLPEDKDLFDWITSIQSYAQNTLGYIELVKSGQPCLGVPD